ncbi:hypothetical protein DVH05_013753 [Phytophthora capsici]|nr:hypothetical protein DVH05_013753 [Phytophthora capsici]
MTNGLEAAEDDDMAKWDEDSSSEVSDMEEVAGQALQPIAGGQAAWACSSTNATEKKTTTQEPATSTTRSNIKQSADVERTTEQLPDDVGSRSERTFKCTRGYEVAAEEALGRCHKKRICIAESEHDVEVSEEAKRHKSPDDEVGAVSETSRAWRSAAV